MLRNVYLVITSSLQSILLLAEYISLSHRVIAHGSVEFCEATPIGLADESKESLYGRETGGDLRSA